MLFFLKQILIMSAHVGRRLIFFLSVVGIFLLVLSVVSIYFSPFVASRLTPFTPSLMSICSNAWIIESLSIIHVQCKLQVSYFSSYLGYPRLVI